MKLYAYLGKRPSVNRETYSRWASWSVATNSSLPIMRVLHVRRRHLFAQSAKSNIIMLSALWFMPTNFLKSIPCVVQAWFNHLRAGYRSVSGCPNCQMSSLQAASFFLYIFNTSATVARQGGWVQLEQSDMHLALLMAKTAEGGFSRATIEETQVLNKTPRAEVWEEKKRGVECPWYQQVKAAIERHLAMLRQNSMAWYLSCQHRTGKNPQTWWRSRGSGGPPPN